MIIPLQVSSGSGSHLPPSLQTDSHDSLPKQLKVIFCPCNAGKVPEMTIIYSVSICKRGVTLTCKKKGNRQKLIELSYTGAGKGYIMY